MRRTVLLVLALVFSLLLACTPKAPLPTRVPATPTHLERELSSYEDAWEGSVDKEAWLLQQGARVTGARMIGDRVPADLVTEEDWIAWGASRRCSGPFPVLARGYGLYYLPDDEDYTSPPWPMDLCFASDRDAVGAGYRRGPRTGGDGDVPYPEGWDGLLLDSDLNEALLARMGITVVAPQPKEGCRVVFPVRATVYGLYFLPSDELYYDFGVALDTHLCFVSERGAIKAGYRRGPHGPR